MTLPAHLLGPAAQPRLDREQAAQAEYAQGVPFVVVWALGIVGSWGAVVLAGWALWGMRP